MKKPLTLFSLLVVALTLVFASTREGASASPTPVPTVAGNGLVTLFAYDDLQSSFNFSTGGAGGVIKEGEVVLEGAHMSFGGFAEDMLSFGYIRNEPVRIIDLGDQHIPSQPRATDRAPKPTMSVFHTLFLNGGYFSYVGPNGKVYRYKPANQILEPLPAEGVYHVEPKIGHTYLVRYHRQKVGSPDRYAKFQVIDFRPGRSLTIRWASIAGN